MTAQPGIFALGTSEHCYLELRLAPEADPARLVAAVASHTESLSTTGGVNVVVGVRPELWPGLARSRPGRTRRRPPEQRGPRARTSMPDLWWGGRDSNPRPRDYESPALTG